jgi:signal transduction histidine kinase
VRFQHIGLEGRRFHSEIETACYRIVQEALTNAARHGGVKEVTVQVWAEQETLFLQIADSGVGFDPRSVLAHIASSGLTGMRERAVLLGGRLAVESAPGAGTRVLAELPLEGTVEKRQAER